MMRDTRCLILLLIFSLSSGSLFAGKPQNKVDSPTLHVDGEFSEKDQELKFLKDELKNVKGLKR
jgi:hypothetical protein